VEFIQSDDKEKRKIKKLLVFGVFLHFGADFPEY